MARDYFLFCLFSLLLIDTATFGFVIPLLPDVIFSKGISLGVLGAILSVYPIGYFIISLVFGKILHKYCKINILYSCQILLIVSNLIFAFLPLFDSPLICIIIATTARALQGIGIGGASSLLYSYVPERYPDKIEETFSFLEISIGSGIVFGSIFAGFLYEYTTYSFSFILMALIYIVSSVILVKLLNHELEAFRLNKLLQTFPADDLSVHSFDGFFSRSKDDDLSYSAILTNSKFVATFLCQCFCCATATLLHPSFSEHVKSLGGSSQDIGLIYAACDITYATTAMFIFKRFLRFGRRKLLLFGGVIGCIGLLIVGPEKYTFLPDSLAIVGLGLAFNGFAQVFFTVPLIPEYIENLEEIFGKNESINEMSSGLFNAGLALSEFMGPIFGGVLAYNFGVGRGMTIYSLILLVYLRIFWMFGQKNDKKRKNLLGSKDLEMKFFSR